jgi:outer membrane protein OmpA-like peptidoglycan-associated protein
LQPPASVQLAVTGSTLRASGTAPWAWHEQLENRFGAIAGIESLDVAGLEISGRVTLEQRVAQLDGKRFYFESGTQLTPESDAALSLQAAAIDEIADDAAGAGLQVSLLIVGSTDSIGNEAMNEQLARRRVGIAENALQSAGVDIVPETRLEYPDAGERPRVEIERRFVQMNVTLLDPAPRQ